MGWTWQNSLTAPLTLGLFPAIYATASLLSSVNIGYRHLLEHLDGRRGLAQTVHLIKRDTRRFAKRQMTWLRRESGFAWLAPANEFQRRASIAVMSQGAQRLMRGEDDL